MRWLGGVILIGSLAVLGWYVASDPGLVEGPAAANQDAAASPPLAFIFAGGVVEGARREVRVCPEISGRIRELHVQEGDAVNPGELLATLEPDVGEFRLQEAQAQLAIATAERRRLDARRLTPATTSTAKPSVSFGEPARNEGRLPASSSASGTRIEPGISPGSSNSTRGAEIRPARVPLDQDELTIADARVSLAEAAVNREMRMAEKARLRSPLSGIVVRVQVEPGELVGLGGDRELFLLVDRSRTNVRAYVEELDAMNVTVGRSAHVAAIGRPQQRYLGKVARCAPSLQPKSHLHRKPGERVDVRVREVIIELDDGSDLLLGLPVEVFIQTHATDPGSVISR